jgi:hypothetical protein
MEYPEFVPIPSIIMYSRLLQEQIADGILVEKQLLDTTYTCKSDDLKTPVGTKPVN